MYFYISDLHLGDKRIFKLCNRPFDSPEDMEEYIVKRWNEKVSEYDDVFVLGDLANGSAKKVKEFFSRVKGRKHLIVGNHDEGHLSEYTSTQSFVSIEKFQYISDEGRKVCICHYPLLDWFSGDKNIYHIYGHIHNKTEADGKIYAEIKNYYRNKPAFNAGVDVTGFEPVTLDELIKLKEVNKNEPYIN